MNPEDEFDIRQYLDILRRRIRVIALAVVACSLGAAAFSFSQENLYSSSAKVLISAQQDITGTGGALSDPNQTQNQMQTQIEIAESPPVELEGNNTLGADADSVESFSASGVPNTRVMQITAVSPSPVIAQKAANAYADAYLKVGQQTAIDRVVSIGDAVNAKRQQLQNQIDDINEKLEARPPPGEAQVASLTGQREAIEAQMVQLQRQYDNAQAAALVREAAAAPFAEAELPTEPTSPKPLRNIALGLVFGLFTGVAIALMRERLDDRVRSSAQLTQWFPRLSHLGTIPRVHEWKHHEEAKNMTLADPRSQTAEAYRGLRTSIEFLSLDRQLGIIEFTSATAGEGKSTTVANLATAMAWAGKDVVIVSADLRRPRVHSFFGLSNEIGLTSVLLNDKPLEEVLQRAPIDTQDGGVFVLATGALPPNPSELLATVAVQDIFIKLRERADYVLIDSPPVLPVADPLVLSKYSDGIALVAGVGALHRRELSRTLEIIETSTKTPLLGVITNGSDEELSYSTKYSYYAAASA